MQLSIKRLLLSLAGMGLVAAALLAVERSGAKPNFGSTEGRWGADHFPNVVLTTQDGKAVRLYDDLLKGKAVAINTFFTGCGDICPLSTAKMRELHGLLGDRVGKDIFFYSISVDPHDTAQTAKAYAERFGAGKGWLFLTGKSEDVQLVMRKLGLGTLQGTDPRESHSSTLMVGHEPSGRWMKNSSTDNPRFLAPTVETFLGWEGRQPSPDYSKARQFEITNGQFLFQNGCSACHTIGEGDKIGPDLADVSKRRDRAWLARFVAAPDKVLAEGDPIATELFEKYQRVRMPNLDLPASEIEEILGYIDARSAAVHARHR